MEKWIKKQYSKEIKKVFLESFGIKEEDCQDLDGFESFVYKVVKNNNQYILKISHDSRRSETMIRGEVNFINYLSGNGLNIPKALYSDNGNLVETCSGEKGKFTAILFEYAEGGLLREEDKNNLLFKNMGKYLGKLHFLSKRYNPEKKMRPDLFEESIPLFDFIPTEDDKVRRAASLLIEELKTLEKSDQSFGMIHVDFHQGNFHVNGEVISLFDFDDCQYSWFIHDIAMAFFYMLPHHVKTENDIINGHNFLNNFIKGYLSENNLDKKWFTKIELFLKLREIELYAIINRSFDPDNLDSWSRSFMTGRKEKIENKVPYFPLNLENF